MSIIYIYLYMYYMLKRRVEQWLCLCGTGLQGSNRQRETEGEKEECNGEQRASELYEKLIRLQLQVGGWIYGGILQLSSLPAAGFDSIRLSFNHFVYLYFLKQPFCCIVVVLDLLFFNFFLLLLFFVFCFILLTLLGSSSCSCCLLLLLLLLLSYIVITFQFQFIQFIKKMFRIPFMYRNLTRRTKN